MSRVLFITFLIFGLSAARNIIQRDGCLISIEYKKGDLKEPQPLILTRNNEDGLDVLYPKKKLGILEISPAEKIYLACPGKNNYLEGIPGLENIKEGEAKCIEDTTFSFNNLKFNFTSLACKYLPDHEARQTGNPCYGNATHVEIGFQLNKDFLRTIEVCRDDITHSTYYTKFKLTKNIGSFHSGYPRPRNWRSGEFHEGYDMDEVYKTSNQIKTIEKLVGSKELADKYINLTQTKFLAKGHMVARADFVYGSIQMSTFWYLNAAPQWQAFNAGNWNSLESDVRQFVQRRSMDLVIYTGVHAQMSLLDINNNHVPVYLYVKGTKRGIPAPRFYWKIIYDPLTKLGTGFVGLNDPYATKITDDMYICEDISKRIDWLNWKPNKLSKGISYACEIEDLRKAIPSIPKIDVIDILL